MTFSSAATSACEVDAVAAIAALATCLRAGGGGKAACWRVAGASAGAGTAGVVALLLAAALVACVVLAVALGVDLGPMLRAIGRGFGSGTFGLVGVWAPADHPMTSTRLVATAVDRNAAVRQKEITACFRGESCDARRPSCISLNMWTKYYIRVDCGCLGPESG